MLRPLIDREPELAELLAAWERARGGRPQLVVVSGHRRVGKTFMLLHFLERLTGARHVYFPATQQAEGVELERFGQALRDGLGGDAPLAVAAGLPDWEIALRSLAERSPDDPLVVVIDEAPYLAVSTRGFASVVQTVWDHLHARARPVPLLLVLTGSATSVMEEMVGADGPLRGRADAHLRLRPFDLPTAARVLGVEPADAVEAYAACGGWPLHLAAWDRARTTAENLEHLAGQPGGLLLEDARLILDELPHGPGFGRVLAAIGRGRTRRADIATEAEQRIDYPLEFLQGTGLVARETPLGAPRRARPLYGIADPYLRFWFHVLFPERSRIEGGQGRQALAARDGEWRKHVGWTFEEAARSHARRLVARGELPDVRVGRWWSTSGAPLEVDVLGLDGARTALVGEAKWSGTAAAARLAERLRAALPRLPAPVEDPVLCLWMRERGAPTPGVRAFDAGDVVDA